MASVDQVLAEIIREHGGREAFSTTQLNLATRLAGMLLDEGSNPQTILEIEKALPARDGADGVKRIYVAPDGEEMTPSVSACWAALYDTMSPAATIEDLEEVAIAWRLFWHGRHGKGGSHGNFVRDLVCTCECGPCKDVGDEILFKAMKLIKHEHEVLERIKDSPASLNYRRENWSPIRREAFRALTPYLLEEAQTPPAPEEAPVAPPQAQDEPSSAPPIDALGPQPVKGEPGVVQIGHVKQFQADVVPLTKRSKS